MKILRSIALVVGVIGFAFAVRTLGWSGIAKVLADTGAWFAVIAVIDVAGAFCDAGAICAFARKHAPLSFGRALAAQLGGVAINRLTPGNALGEPIKMSILSEELPRDSAVSTILMFDIAATCVAITAIVVGIPITLVFADLPPNIAHAAWIGASVLIVVAVLLVLLVKRGLVRAGVRTLRGIRAISSTRAETWCKRTAHIDAMVKELGARHTWPGIAGLAGSRICNWIGTVVMLHAAGLPITPGLVIGILTVGALVTWISHIVPLGLGLAEGGNYLLYRALGAPGVAGLDFSIVYRARTCVLAAIGLAVLAITSYRDRRRRATVMA